MYIALLYLCLQYKKEEFYVLFPNNLFIFLKQGGSRTTSLACFRDPILLQSL